MRDAVTRVVRDETVAEVSRRMLASLPRRDQRLKGEKYVEGLLRVPGRKTMRAIAAAAGGGAAEQSVHHFISKSSWDWSRVRRDLGQYVDEAIEPQAWVVHPLAIPKWGRHSVGVQESYVAALGRVANSQQAYGVWLASETVSAPVNWHLLLPEGWLTDDERRRRAEIPEDVSALDADRALLDVVGEMAGDWPVRRRPVVLDGRQAEDLVSLVDALRRAGIPFVMRVGPTAPLAPCSGGEGGGADAASVAERARPGALPVRWMDPEGWGAARVPLATRVPVVLAAPGRRAAPTPLALVAAWNGTAAGAVGAGAGADELWLSNLFAASAADLLRLGRLVRRVETDATAIGGRVGLRDFEGRCYGGWHRHVTLCSIAHAVVAAADA
ncbi:IS701 family transposase [Streptomyces vilmorinianum]|uniref:IS701 family transposase n=1 Tax=Streptomyces vilmorinianum TaxID=3051092 RepID=UPI0020C77AC9|nr:transposase [Streptomyces vilmorinianum]